jgi:hypothetical protein
MAAAPPAAPSALGNEDARLYQWQISYLEGSAPDAQKIAAEYQEIGALDSAMRTLEKASGDLALAKCLKNQQDQRVPFYQGQAMCKASLR